MNGNQLQIGDEVLVDIPDPSRHQGLAMMPKKVQGKVLGFGETFRGRWGYCRNPGVYENRNRVNVKLETGGELFVHYSKVSLLDKELATLRALTYVRGAVKGLFEESQFLRELPDTFFWEGDLVNSPSMSDEGMNTPVAAEFMVASIDYNQLNLAPEQKQGFPIYKIRSIRRAWESYANADDLELVARGNVWKFYHGEKTEFPNLQDEAEFYYRLGLVTELRNPKSRDYVWTISEAREALQIGYGHLILGLEYGFFGNNSGIQVFKFDDEAFGVKVARAMLREKEVEYLWATTPSKTTLALV